METGNNTKVVVASFPGSSRGESTPPMQDPGNEAKVVVEGVEGCRSRVLGVVYHTK